MGSGLECFSPRRVAGCMTCGVALLFLSIVVSAEEKQDGLKAAVGAVAPIMVGAGGKIFRDGKPYRAIGINYFSAFSRTLADRNDTSYEAGFVELAKHRIPFVRLLAGGFYPVEWKLYQEDPSQYFAQFDGVLAAAEKVGIGVIPSLFWCTYTIPDVVGEPRNQLGNPDSKTIAFMRRYIRDVVTRYRFRSVVWAWELGNEYNLEIDISNLPPVLPHLGTPAARDKEADVLSQEILVTVVQEFAKAVREVDPVRPISTGNSLPRFAAAHLHREYTWEPDSVEEFKNNLLAISPGMADLVSIHLYSLDQQRFGRKDVPYMETLKLALEAASSVGKCLYVGEFGASDAQVDGGPDVARAQVEAMFAAIESCGVSLASLWNFDLPIQEDTINVTGMNHRACLLDEIEKANVRLAGAAVSVP